MKKNFFSKMMVTFLVGAVSYSVFGDQQTISNFLPVDESTYVTTNEVDLSATASSGLDVTFAVLSGPGAINNSTNLTFMNIGKVVVTADQAGNGTYDPAPTVTNTYYISLADVVGHWTFNDGETLTDLTGNFADLTMSGATISGGQLHLDSGQWARCTSYTGPSITEKTLVSWVIMEGLDVTAGGPLAIATVDGNTFDAIVYGERQYHRWMSGSDYWRRTQYPNPGCQETTTGELVQMAISYENSGGSAHVKIYRNGVLIGDYTQGSIATWNTTTTEAIFGPRVTNAGSIDASICEARIYGSVLSQTEIQEIYNNFLSSSISTVSPSSGNEEGGFQVTISGIELGNGSDVTDVTLCGTSVTSIDSQTTNQIVVTAAAGTAGTGDVVVTSDSLGVITKLNGFTYIDSYNGDWSSQSIVLTNTPEADLMARTGDIDNLGFGWATDFNPFTGNSTTSHGFPFFPSASDATGTDEIYRPSSYTGNPPAGQDGYTSSGISPEAFTLTYDLGQVEVTAATLQIFVDDFQASLFHADWQASFDGRDAPFLSEVINALNQTGPIGKLVTVEIPGDFLNEIKDGSLSIVVNDTTTGAGDGYAIDFGKLLLNVSALEFTASVTGTVTAASSSLSLPNALVRIVSSSGYSTSDGNYLITEVPTGLVMMEVSCSGYISQTRIIDLTADELETQNFALVTDSSVTTVSFTDGSAYIPSGTELKNCPFGRCKLLATDTGASLAGTVIQLNGVRTGVSNLRLWSSTDDDSFDSDEDTQLGVTTADDPGAGNNVIFSGLSASIPTTGVYLFVTCDVTTTATGIISGVIETTGGVTLEGGIFSSELSNESLSGAALNLTGHLDPTKRGTVNVYY